VQRDSNAREAPAVLTDDPGQEEGGGRAQEADRQGTDLAPRRPPCQLDGPVGMLEDLLHFLQEDLALRGQAQGARVSHEELDAEFPLEVGHCLAERPRKRERKSATFSAAVDDADRERPVDDAVSIDSFCAASVVLSAASRVCASVSSSSRRRSRDSSLAIASRIDCRSRGGGVMAGLNATLL